MTDAKLLEQLARIEQQLDEAKQNLGGVGELADRDREQIDHLEQMLKKLQSAAGASGTPAPGDGSKKERSKQIDELDRALDTLLASFG